jgi:hypothetical protein
MVNQLVIYRTISIALVAAIFIFGEREFIRAVFFPYIFIHYVVAFIFAFKKGSLANKPKRYLPSLVGLTIASYLLSYFQVLNILVYFGIHFVLTELYIFRFLNWTESKSLLYTRIPFNIIAYSFFARSAPIIGENFSTNTFIIAGLLSFIGIIYLCFRNKEKFPIYEVPMFIAFIVCSFLDLNIPPYGVLFYHVTLWYFLPIIKYKRGAIKPTIIQLALFLGLLSFIQLGGASVMKGMHGANPIGLFAIFHITISFATSVLNPKPIQHFFGYR